MFDGQFKEKQELLNKTPGWVEPAKVAQQWWAKREKEGPIPLLPPLSEASWSPSAAREEMVMLLRHVIHKGISDVNVRRWAKMETKIRGFLSDNSTFNSLNNYGLAMKPIVDFLIQKGLLFHPRTNLKLYKQFGKVR